VRQHRIITTKNQDTHPPSPNIWMTLIKALFRALVEGKHAVFDGFHPAQLLFSLIDFSFCLVVHEKTDSRQTNA
jgi:hypothetical protein